jgi:hypothetical protein
MRNWQSSVRGELVVVWPIKVEMPQAFTRLCNIGSVSSVGAGKAVFVVSMVARTTKARLLMVRKGVIPLLSFIVFCVFVSSGMNPVSLNVERYAQKGGGMQRCSPLQSGLSTLIAFASVW